MPECAARRGCILHLGKSPSPEVILGNCEVMLTGCPRRVLMPGPREVPGRTSSRFALEPSTRKRRLFDAPGMPGGPTNKINGLADLCRETKGFQSLDLSIARAAPRCAGTMPSAHLPSAPGAQQIPARDPEPPRLARRSCCTPAASPRYGRLPKVHATRICATQLAAHPMTPAAHGAANPYT